MNKRKRFDSPLRPQKSRIMELVQAAYELLPKHGKPADNESTVLAAIVLISADATFSLVSLATGTKCMGEVKRQEDGSIVHDLHAEVLARRTAMYWVYQQLKHCLSNNAVQSVTPQNHSMFLVPPSHIPNQAKPPPR